MSSVLAILTRSTSDPRIKARLSPRLSSTARRDLALAFMDDLIDRGGWLEGVRVRLAVTPPIEGLRVDRPGLSADTFMAQRGGGLGERQRHVLEDLAARGFTQVVMIGADVPDLPLRFLQQAFAWLNESGSTVVVGPCDDGGCYLIGATVKAGAVPDVFTNVRWDTPHALEDLTRSCAQAGLTVRRLEIWNDVDAPDDLDRLAGRLRDAPDAAPHTAAFLRTQKL